MTINNFSDIVREIIQKEEQLALTYGQIKAKFSNRQSKELMRVLKSEQEHTVNALKQIDLKEFRLSEFIKNLPAFRNDMGFTQSELPEKSSPAEIFDKILDYEEKLLQYYKDIRKILVFQKSKEFMDSLVQFKLGQIKKIKSYADSPELVV